MFIIKTEEKIVKPKYGKVIALTAITVAAVETLAIIGIATAKKIIQRKRAEAHIDEDFIMIPHTEDCSVHFEVTEEASDEISE